MATKPPLLKQGDLDGLCGPYAILNAIRTASARHKVRSSRLEAILNNDDVANEIFLRMMQNVAGRSIADPVFWGIGTGRLMRLLGVTAKLLERNYGLCLSVRRPFSRQRPVHPHKILRKIDDHLKTAGAAVIIGSRSPWDHWTAVKGVARTRMLLADSGGYHYVPLRPGRSDSAPHAGLIEAHCVFLLNLAPLKSETQGSKKSLPSRSKR